MKKEFNLLEISHSIQDVYKTVPYGYFYANKRKIENLYIDNTMGSIKKGRVAGVSIESSILKISTKKKYQFDIILAINVGLALFRILIKKYPETKWKTCFLTQNAEIFTFNISESNMFTLKDVLQNIGPIRLEMINQLISCSCEKYCGNCFPLRQSIFKRYQKYIDKSIIIKNFN
ncbi:MAG: hypothetical protein INQ03_06235 [Candidatus Heimdallarchaeota archaeon]|nr:hypothetical protein [Candidatus Heimdallarchaeota archaeon]